MTACNKAVTNRQDFADDHHREPQTPVLNKKRASTWLALTWIL
jgi:hypothetical protein